MSKRPQSTYRNSDLARSKVKKNRVVTLFSNIFMQHPSEIGLVEDRSNSTTIIRIIVGLLLVHIIIIGGIILHGKIEEEHETTVATLVPPPSAPVTEVKKNIRPEPKTGPQSNPAHISQVTAANAQATQQPVQPVAVVTPTQVQQTATTTPVAPATPANTASRTEDTPYKTVTLTSGKSLNALAREHGITLQQILAINPNITNPNIVAANTKIRIPLAADSAEAKDINQRKEEQRIQKEGLPYKVKRGDMLGPIAKRFGTSVEAIQKLNNMGKSTNIRIGQEIKIPATDKARKALQK